MHNRDAGNRFSGRARHSISRGYALLTAAFSGLIGATLAIVGVLAVLGSPAGTAALQPPEALLASGTPPEAAVLEARLARLDRQMNEANEAMLRIIAVMERNDDVAAHTLARIAALRRDMDRLVTVLPQHRERKTAAPVSP